MTDVGADIREASSFRDPGGFLFRRLGTLYRQVNPPCRENYRLLMQSGLYDRLVERGLLIPHREVETTLACTSQAACVIQPERVEFISYPYEWCFSQLQHAALATLEIQKQAMECGMSLRDASAYNLQFCRGRWVLIDTLSFEPCREGRPWAAYRQFCQHFLAPLALMARRDVRLGGLLRSHIDGIPLDLASRLLGRGLWLSPRLFLHIRLHAASQKKYADRPSAAPAGQFSRLAFLGLIESLQAAAAHLRWTPGHTQWGDYYTFTNYSDRSMEHKAQLVGAMLARLKPATVWDLGANTGRFSRLASAGGAMTVAFDIDPAAVEKNYLQAVRDKETHLLPLLMDLANPSPDLGWAGRERDSLQRRGPADAVLALALVHHLAIANNVPLDRVADYLARLGRHLIIEFVPKADSQVQRLLAGREDIFDRYDQANFESAFRGRFEFGPPQPVEGSSRVLYLMKTLTRGGEAAQRSPAP